MAHLAPGLALPNDSSPQSMTNLSRNNEAHDKATWHNNNDDNNDNNNNNNLDAGKGGLGLTVGLSH